MEQSVQKFIGAIRDEALNFRFGEPWRYTEKNLTCILPILRPIIKTRNYVLLCEAKKSKIEDTGSISKVRIINKEDLPIFIRSGEIFEGSTQQRASTKSLLVFPGETEISVVCVNASRPISISAKMETVGFVPNREALYSQSYINQVDSQNEGNPFWIGRGINSLQGASWGADQEYSTYLHEQIPSSIRLASGYYKSDDITNSIRTAKAALNELLKDVPLFQDQVGIVLIDTNGVYLLDTFDSHTSWKAIKELLIGKEALAIANTSNEEGVFTYNPEKAKEVTKTILGKGKSDEKIYEEKTTKTYIIDMEGYIGEAVTLDDEVIHLLIARN